jgi:hypothetical protein
MPRTPPRRQLYALGMNEIDESTSDSAGGSLRLRSDVAWREINDEIVLLDLTGSTYFTVTRTGVALWPLLVQGSTIDELSEHLAQTFSLERQTAERDVSGFISTLSDEGLLEPQA